MATIEQLQQALINADKAGDTAAATALAQALKQANGGASIQTLPPARQILPDAHGMGTGADYPQPTLRGVTSQGMSGVNEGIANTLGFPVDAVNSAIGGVFGLVNKATGTNLQASDNPAFGSQFFKNALAPTIAPPSIVPAEAFARTVGREATPVLLGGVAGGAGVLPSLATAATSGLGAATAGAVSHDNPLAEAGGSLAGGGLSLGIQSWIAKRAAQAAAVNNVPSVDVLKGQASAKYQEGQANGVIAAQPQTTALSDTMKQIATDQGVISPTGRVNSNYTKVGEALKTFEDYAQGTMTPTQVQAVRGVLQDAAAADGKEGFVGTQMLKAFDQFTTQLAPELRQGDALYTRASRGKTIETAIQLAKDHAANGKTTLDLALRNEFGKLQDQITKGTLPGFNADQIAAIGDVARTGSTRAVARWAGSFTPKSFTGLTLKEGVPVYLGNMAAGPVGGAAAGGGALALGYGGQAVANSLARRAADTASAVARNGGRLVPQPQRGVSEVAAALLAAQAMNPGRYQ